MYASLDNAKKRANIIVDSLEYPLLDHRSNYKLSEKKIKMLTVLFTILRRVAKIEHR